MSCSTSGTLIAPLAVASLGTVLDSRGSPGQLAGEGGVVRGSIAQQGREDHQHLIVQPELLDLQLKVEPDVLDLVLDAWLGLGAPNFIPGYVIN